MSDNKDQGVSLDVYESYHVGETWGVTHYQIDRDESEIVDAKEVAGNAWPTNAPAAPEPANQR